MQLVLVDDHQMFRAALRALLSLRTEMEVVGEAGDATEAVRIAEATQPDVIVVDLQLPGPDGIAVTRELVRRRRTAKVLILSATARAFSAAQALAAGAKGYAVKTQSGDELMGAIESVARGEGYLAPGLSRMLVQQYLGAAPQPGVERAVADPLAALSAREREVFGLAIRGTSNEGIARHLVISVKTVETHRTNINRKLRVHSTADMVRFAAVHGLLLD
jgi:DNA-binding NarL/FixJ family response regulator